LGGIHIGRGRVYLSSIKMKSFYCIYIIIIK
jgi:hypothetical protein